jgi:hypothetical protein
MKCQRPRRLRYLSRTERASHVGWSVRSAEPIPASSCQRCGGLLVLLAAAWTGLVGGPVWSQGVVDPAPSEQAAAVQSGEALWIAAQRICPVSGLALGKHGPPVKVAVGEQRQELFLCCAPCASQPIRAEHWKTIHQNLAAAQGTCPVMQLPLRDGAPWTICRGRVVFVCCPPCVDTIADEPEATLARVRDNYRLRLGDSAELQTPRADPAIR